MLSGINSEQSNTILSLVSIAENSTTDWKSNYTYIEDISDGRGSSPHWATPKDTCIYYKNFILEKFE